MCNAVAPPILVSEIDPRHRIFRGVHLIRQVPKGGRHRIAESSKIPMAFRPDNGDDLAFVSHHDDEFRREDIGGVRPRWTWEFDNHDFSLCRHRHWANASLMLNPRHEEAL